MKKRRSEITTLIVLFCIHELLLIVIGMGLALRIESGEGINGTALVFPLALLLVTFGWMLRGCFKDME